MVKCKRSRILYNKDYCPHVVTPKYDMDRVGCSVGGVFACTLCKGCLGCGLRVCAVAMAGEKKDLDKADILYECSGDYTRGWVDALKWWLDSTTSDEHLFICNKAGICPYKRVNTCPHIHEHEEIDGCTREEGCGVVDEDVMCVPIGDPSTIS